MSLNESKQRSSACYAGAAKADITPPLGTFVNGDFVSHYAQFVHDNLYAKALVLKQGDVTIALVVVDICVMPKEFVDSVKALITERTGIPYEHIMISSTHTHAAGSVASVYLCASDLLYTKKLPPLIADAVINACEKLQPANIAFGSVDVPEHVRCRRYQMHESYKAVNPVSGEQDVVKTNPIASGHLIEKPVGVTDPQVSFLAVRSINNQWISLLANYSLHYVGDWPNGTISADYYGEFSKSIKQKLGADEEFVGMMSNGTSGNINIWEFVPTGKYPMEDFRKSEYIGKDIADKVYQAMNNLQWETEPMIEVQYKELQLSIRRPTEEQLQRAKKIIAETNYENLHIDDVGLRGLYAREQVLLNEFDDQLLFPLQAFKVGSGIIGALGGEIFAETGLWLKANASSEKYFTIGLANANLGYVPPSDEFKRGGYETWRGRTSKMEEGAEEKIRLEQLKLMKKVSADGKA
jgi:neutral ceramidase